MATARGSRTPRADASSLLVEEEHLRLAHHSAADGHTLTLAAVPAKRTWTISARHNCPGDWNLDGALDIFDIIEYLSDLDAGHPQADLNADGAADIFDILAYLNDFASGC